LLNPDDGRPVWYTLEVSLDDKTTWIPIGEGISGNSYLWDASGWPTEAEYWFRVTGYSIDGTLSGFAESDMTYSIISGVDSRPSGLAIQVYPNPASGMVFVETADNEPVELRLYAPFGQLLMSTSDKKLDVRGLPVGLYRLEMQTRHGVAVRKLNVIR